MAKINVSVELFYGGAWHDITATDDVLTRDPITIKRVARAPSVGSSSPPTSSLNLTLDNRDGMFSPRSPMSPLYRLIGRNTPIRVAVLPHHTSGASADVNDTFARVVANAWGSSGSGGIYTNFGAGGTILASEFQVTGSAATQSVLVAATYRASYLPDVVVEDADVAVTWAVPQATGGALEPANIMLRMTSLSSFVLARTLVETTNAVTVRAFSAAGVDLGSATVPGLTHAGTGTPLRTRARIIGRTVFMRVWNPAGAEPSTWHLVVTDPAHPIAGSIGVRSGRATGNSNTSPVVFTYDDFTSTTELTRFVGEVAAWPQDWTVDGKDVWSAIDAAGIMLRLTAPGTTVPVVSALRRDILAPNASDVPYTYYPMEEGSDASGLVDVVGGGTPMVSSGTGTGTGAGPNFGSNSIVPGSGPLPALTERQLDWAFPYTGGSDTQWSLFFAGTINGSLASMNRFYMTNGSRVQASFVNDLLSVEFYDAAGSFVDGFDESGTAFSNWFDGLPHGMMISVQQSGGTVNWKTTYFSAAGGYSTHSDSYTGTISRLATGVMNLSKNEGSACTFGHVAAWPTYTVGDDYGVSLRAHPGETALARMIRLCAQTGIAFTYLGAPSETTPMGVQRVATTTNLLFDAADADMGLLYEPRGFLGLTYRTRYNLYNQSPALTLNYAAGGEVAPPLKPVEDWNAVANDVRVTRYQGSSARVVQTTGPLNVQSPTADPDGVGRYDQAPTLVLYADAQALNHAGWIKHLGTWDEARYPVVNADLAAMAVDAKTALIAQTASLNIGDRLAINHPPAWVPPDDIVQLAQGFAEVIESHRWSITANATPALPYEVFVIGSGSGNRSRIPAGPTTTLAGTMTTTSTSRTVTSTATPWIDSAGYPTQFPFDIIVAGERMTVTAIAGTASPQTFTVVRSVNGVVKTHLAGEPVQLFRPAVIRL